LAASISSNCTGSGRKNCSVAQLDHGQSPSGIFIAYSTAPDDVADGGDGRDSPYTLALVDAISQPGIKVEDAFKETSAGPS
jgi:uncharacterized caspase-like protein